VPYTPGTLEAVGYTDGKKITTDNVKTTGEPAAIALSADKPAIKADKEDIAMVTIQVNDKNKLRVPIADNDITFSISGPGKIIGVGNGNPTSLEPDKFLERIGIAPISRLKEKIVGGFNNTAEVDADYNDTTWQRAFTDKRDSAFGKTVKAIIYRGSFILPDDESHASVTFYYSSLGKMQSVYVNGKKLGDNLPADKNGNVFKLAASLVHPGRNTIAIEATPLIKEHSWDGLNTHPGLIQLTYPADKWKRKLFNGLAQVIIQSTGEPGQIVLTATSPGVKPAELKINATPAVPRDAVASADND
jgi:beta-galactosidase